MAVENIEVAERFREALEEAVRSGDLEDVYPLLAPDVEWVTPQRDLRGIDEVETELTWISPQETFDFEFSDQGWVDHGRG